MRKDLLKEILGIPTYTNEETDVIKFLQSYAARIGVVCATDAAGNVFMTKGHPQSGNYPLVCAHTDSVHSRVPMKIVEENGRLFALHATTGRHIGCGGDDKAGVFICLEMLERQDCLKAAFFVGEERYCIGSRAAAPHFFLDVGYCMEFDSPQGDIISYSCNGIQLFKESSSFADAIVPLMEEHKVIRWQHHPYTDVAILKERYDFACINLPAGYYHMHSSNEYVMLSDVENSVILGGEMLDALGLAKYKLPASPADYGSRRKVSGLVLDNREK